MKTVAEIERAIEQLPLEERESLESKLFSRRFGLNALAPDQRQELLASLDQAERDIDEGRGTSADDLRKAMRSWIGR